MASSSTRNNIMAGTFLLSSVVLAVLASFVLSDLGERMRSTNEYIVRFSIAQGATGIKAGSPVLLGGQPVGKVSGVEINTLNGQPGIDINVQIDAKYQLFDNAMVFLEKPLLGSLTSINIASMGSAGAVQKESQIGPGPELAAGERIAGAIAPPSFLADAGLGTEQVMDFKQIIAEAKLAVEKINSLIDSNEELVTATLTDIRGAAGDARGAVKDVTERVPGWTKQVDSIITSIDTTAADFPRLRDTARDLLNDGRGLVGDSRALIGENREQIDRFIDNIDASAITLRDSIEPLATKARQAMDSFESLSTRLDTIVSSEAPNIRRTLANARLASDQLKLTLMEVRAQPWRLLVQPDTKELQQQLLYDSARSYASAVSDLRAATESLDSMIERGVAGPEEVREIADRRNELEEAFKRYREAEKKMFEQFERSGR